jgi:hypothetical protein
MTGREILERLNSAKLLICSRSNGLIKPSSMKIGSLEDLLRQKYAASRSVYRIRGSEKTYVYIHAGIYECLPDGTFKNIHSQIRKLINLGYLDLEGAYLVRVKKD